MRPPAPTGRPARRTRIAVLAAAVTVAGLPLVAHAAARPAPRQAVSGAAVAPDHWTPRKATYGVTTEKDVAITMSDGVVIRADVYRPATKSGAPAKGRFPVILTQTPYNKITGATLAFVSDYLVSRGYVQVVADVRGTGASGGEWASFSKREQRDGYELAQWCTSHKRSWSNGKLALHGTSYGAINQLLTAAQHPRGLKAEFPIVPMGDAYRDVAWASGAVDTGFIPFWLGLVSVTGLAPDTLMNDPVAAADAIGAHVRGATDFQTKVLAGGTTGGPQAFDGPFYRERSPINVIDKVDVPTFVVGGEFDIFQRGEPMIYSALRRNGVPTRLLLGPWYHTTAGNGLPSQNVPSVEELELRWFDHYVRGVRDPGLNRTVAPVTYFENGTGKWRTADNYLDGVKFASYRLGGAAAPGSPGTLGTPKSTGADTLPWLPVTGPCSRGTTQWTAGLASGIPCETNNAINDTYGLSYDLPVTHTLHLRGPINAHLFVESNGRDAMITARVEDVAPDGTVTQLTAGWQTLGLRALTTAKSRWIDGQLVQPYHPYTKKSLLAVPSGEAVPVDVEIFPTAAAILPGHTLRLTLQPADEPHLTPTIPQAVGSAGAVLTFVHDARHPSVLTLPVRR